MKPASASRWNLSQWALRHRSLVIYCMLVVAVFGGYGYTQLSRSEDPTFTIKTMVVNTQWPGASADQVRLQVTRRIARELRELPHVDFIQAYSRPGESMVFVYLKGSVPADHVQASWYQVRKHVGDMARTLPQGVIGPFFNDEFGDVYTNIYALSGADYSAAELKAHADRIRDVLLRVPDVAKVDYFGQQRSRVFVDVANARLATLGITPQQIVAALRQHNAMTAAGYVNTASDHILIHTDAGFDDVASIRALTLRGNGHLVKLGDIAHVHLGTERPPAPAMRLDGKPVLGVGVTMAPGGNVLDLGAHLQATVARLQQSLPLGLTLAPVTSMPDNVHRAIDEFVAAVGEAVVIVLLVSLVTLGLRTGTVVVVTIPLVLAATALLMWLFGIGLDKVSLGTLILALGLLVDDAIIAIEMMTVKLEQGWGRTAAAGYAYTSTAFPMLTGTLITVAGFLPIALARSDTGEYTRAIFQVSAIVLSVSWLASVIVVPYLGYHLIRVGGAEKEHGLGAWWRRRTARLLRRSRRPATAPAARSEEAVYATPFYRRFRTLVAVCVRHRKTVMVVTAGLFALSLVAFTWVPQQFFPTSDRPELLVDLQLPDGASRAATERQVRRLEEFLDAQPGVVRYASFVGRGAPRFFLPLDEKLPQRNFAQILVLTPDIATRERLRQRLQERLRGPGHAMVRGRVTRLVSGMPISYPVQYRVSGPDLPRLRALADQVLTVVRAHPDTVNVHLNWDEPDKVVRLDIDPDRARRLGVSASEVADFVHMSLAGQTVTNLRVGGELVGVELRAPPHEGTEMARLRALAMPLGDGRSVPLTQIARLRYVQQPGLIWGRDGVPTVTIDADLRGGALGIDVTGALDTKLKALREALPLGYHIEAGGEAEGSTKASASIVAGVPFMLFAIFTLLMVQLQSMRRTVMVALTAPLGLIGVVAALLLLGQPFGFVAMLGCIAMLGIIMRNSVILVDQIEQDIRAGLAPAVAVVEATVRRFRPIMLTAAAAVLALIPLARSTFFGPMAVALMGGISVATVLTLLFLPALYAASMRVDRHGAHLPSGE